MQCYGNNKNAYQINVDVNITSGGYTVTNTKPIDFSYATSPYKNYKEDDGAKALLEKYYDDYAFGYEVLGYNSTWRSPAVLMQKLADLYLAAGLEKWGSSYNIVLGGGYMSCRGSGLQVGSVTYADIDDLFPFDNDIQLCSVRGSNFRNTKYIKGDSKYYLAWTEYGEEVRYDIDNYTTYYIVTDKYGSDYKYNYLTVVDTYRPNYYARDLLAQYIREGNFA